MTEIVLRNGERIIVDDEDYQRVSQLNWRVELYEQRKPAVCTEIRIGGVLRKISLARFILGLEIEGKVQKDPKADPFDFQKKNLFIGTAAQIKRLRGKPKGEFSSQYKGVYLLGSCWRATLQIRGKTLSLGLFETEESAAAAYDEAIDKFLGGKGFKNFSA